MTTYRNFFYISAILVSLVSPLNISYAKTFTDLFDNLMDYQDPLLLNCSLKGVKFDKKCKVTAEYMGSTMGHAVTVYFPNGKKADYRVRDYDQKTMEGYKDSNAEYQVKSSSTKFDIYRNKQLWIKMWKGSNTN